jgi:HAD superfamily hydrolase (TIGR01484 family)
MAGDSLTTRAVWRELLEPLRAEPAKTAILTDFDGTLAPIVERAEDAALPGAAREVLARLVERYGLVGAVSGRRAAEVRGLVDVDGLYYAGNHGLELLLPGDAEPRPDPSVAGREREAAQFLARTEAGAGGGRVGRLGASDTADPGGRLATAGLRPEDKGPIQALHWRGAADEDRAAAVAAEIATAAERAGLEARWGRKVLELRPLGGGGKDAAMSALLAEAGVEQAVYAGDDRTDVDAFRRLGELRDAGELRTAVRVGILSPEGPPEIAEESDVSVSDPAGWLEILTWLAE